MHTITRELRGIPAWLLKEYMETLGGKVAADGSIIGTGWQAQLIQMEDYAIGSLKVGQVRLEWQGDDEAYQTIWPRLEIRLIRVGG